MTVAIKFDKDVLDKNPQIGKYVTSNYIAKFVTWCVDSRYRRAVELKGWLKDQVTSPPQNVVDFANSIPGAATFDDLMMNILIMVRANLSYVSDDKNPLDGNAIDYWEKATEAVSWKEGDCEDGAILQYVVARLKGVPADRLMIWTGDTSAGGHACLFYRPDYYPLAWAAMDWCFVDNKRTKVATEKGLKRFKDIIPGEKVLSFNEKTGGIEYSTVLRTSVRSVKKILKISYFTGKTERSVECTPEHPFYVRGTWVKAEDLKVGDEVFAASNTHLAKGIVKRPKSRETIDRITATNRMRGVYARTAERQRTNNVFTRNDVRKKLSMNNCMKKPGFAEAAFFKRMQSKERTTPEKKLMERIERLQLPVKFVGDGSFWVNRKNPDFKVIDEKKVIEVTQFNFFGRNEKYARERIKHFETYGFKCLVVFYDKHCKTSSVSDEELSAFVLNGFKITKIEEQNRDVEVWNLHCDNNNNYFVNGILVHNCFYPDITTFQNNRQLFIIDDNHVFAATNTGNGLGMSSYAVMWCAFNEDVSVTSFNYTYRGSA